MLCLFIDSPYFIKFNHIWAYYMNLIWNTIESYDIKYDLDTALIHPIHIHLLPIIWAVFACEMISRGVLPIICAVFAREMIGRGVLAIICAVFAREMIGRLAQASNIREISCRWGQSKSLTPTPTHFVKDINI